MPVLSIDIELVVITQKSHIVFCLAHSYHKITDTLWSKCGKGVKRKGTFSPASYESAKFGRPRVGWWISAASLKSTMEVAEIMQGVGLINHSEVF